MKRSIILFALVFIVAVFAQPDSYLVGPEGFDAEIPAAWTIINGGDATETWYWWNTMQLARIDYGPTAQQADFLITTAFDGTAAADSIILEYWHQLFHFPVEAGSCYVLLSVDGGLTWPETLVTIPEGTGTESETITMRIDNLATALSGNCQIAFFYGYYNSNYWYIDDVWVGLFISEPSPPIFDHITYYHPVFPEAATSYPETVYIDDVTGVRPTSVQMCYDVDAGAGYSGSFTCLSMSAVSIDGNGRGTYTAEIPMLDPWNTAIYYFLAQDTYVPPTMGVSDTFELTVQGPYYAYDNTDVYPETPNSTFRDISTVGTDLAISADDARTAVALPFVFRFYGYDYNTIWACSNGWITFGTTDPGTNDYSNDPIPTASGINGFVAPLWDDLTMGDGTVYSYTTPDGDTLIIEYYDARELSGATYYTFEVMLVNPAICDEVGGNGEIMVKYQNIDVTGLDDATIGVENELGIAGTEYLYNGTYGTSAYIVDGAAALPPGPSAIKFSTNRPPGGVIRGHVTLIGETDHSGVQVSTIGTPVVSDITDATGFFTLNVPAGTYDVYAYNSYHWTSDTSTGITVAIDETVDVDFSLTHLPFSTLFFNDFETDDGGLTVSGGGWEWGAPTSGPGAAHSGTNLWATVLAGNYASNALYSLETPAFDFTYMMPPIYISFWHWYDIEPGWDYGYLDVSTDGGGIWTNLMTYSAYDMTWRDEGFDLSTYAGESSVIIRWFLDSDGSFEYSGWYLDDVGIEAMMSSFAIIEGQVTLFGESDHSGVSVGIIGPMTTSMITPTDGTYEFIVPPGEYDIYAYNGTTWETDTVYDIDVADGDTARVNFVLHPIPMGYVLGYADLTSTPGVPDAGIDCDLLGGTVAPVATDGTGMFFFDEVPTGTYAVKASFAGHNTQTSGLFDVAAGETTYVDTIFLSQEPLFFDFEADDGGFTPSPAANAWEWGTPAAGPTSAYSGLYCWGTDLDYYYVDYSDWQLTYDLTAYSAIIRELQFYHWYNTETGFDGGNVSISTDGGFIWQVVTPEDGYDYIISTSFGNPIGGEPAFSGSSGVWVHETIDLTAYTGTITHFRFRLGADDSFSSYYGWYVDDVFFPTLTAPEGCVEGYVYDATTYTVIPGAEVTCQGQTTYADATGYFMLCDIPIGYWQVYASYEGYASNFKWAVIAQDTTYGRIHIPLMQPTFDPSIEEGGLDAELSYGSPDSAFIEICNPYDHPIEVTVGGGFDGGGGTLCRTTAFGGEHELVGMKLPAMDVERVEEVLLKGRENDNGYTLWQPGDGFERIMAPMASGDIVDSIDLIVPAVDVPWGMGCVGMFTNWSYWVSSIFSVSPSQNVEFDLDGNFTGVGWRTTWAGSWPGDMTYDGINMWQVNVGGDNALYGWLPASGEVTGTISDPDAIWDGTSQRGVAYDAAEDVFYIGGWNDDIVYKIKGESWDNPGQIIAAWGLDAVAGIAFHPGRRTVWVCQNNPDNTIIEFDPESGTVYNVLSYGWMGGYALAGAEIDADGRLWVVSMNQYKAYAIELPVGNIPTGIGFGPSSFTLEANSCTTIVVFTSGNNSPGTYEFDVPITFEGGQPIYYPITITISPEMFRGWNLVAFPVAADPNNIYVQLADDITPFSNDPPNSQIFAWDAQHGIYITPEEFERGRGYYLWAWYDDTKFDVSGVPYYNAMILTLPYYPSSAIPGWNLVGNPVNTPLDWDMVVADPAFTGINATYYALTAAGWATYSPGFPGGADRYIEPYMGFFVLVQPGATGVLPMGDNAIVHSMLKTAVKVEETTLPDFTFRVGIENGDNLDKWNYLATRSTAEDGFDYTWDAPEPPIPSGDPLASFWCDGEGLMRDVKHTMEDSDIKSWTLHVYGTSGAYDVVMNWPLDHIPDGEDGSQGLNQIYEGYEFDLYDAEAGIHIDMRTTDSYVFDGDRTFIITVSATYLGAENKKLPDVYALKQNVPNPFNAATEIAFALPENCDVSLEVIDLSGHRVRKLLGGNMPAGLHSVVWDGLDNNGESVVSGVYFYRLTAGDFAVSKKMLLVK